MMETLSYADFSRGIHQQGTRKRVPLSGAIEVTRRCPLNCAHCYNNLPLGDPAVQSRELTFREHCRILDEISEAGCLWVLYTGGEIFVRKDFLDIYTYAKQKGLLITLFTNGTLITEKVADYLAEWRPFSIEITLYGRTRETYERITGVKGSFNRCLQGIRLIKERGLPLKIKTMAMTLNQHEIQDMMEFVKGELGLGFRFDAMINPRVECLPGPLAVRLTPQQVIDLDSQYPLRMKEWEKFSKKFNGPVHPLENSDEMYHCGGGVNSFSIDPYGQLSICILSNDSKWDLRTGSFAEGWESFLLAIRKRKIKKPNKCTFCEIRAMCGMCPANAELENKDAEEPVDFLCQVAHLRAKALGFSLRPHGDCEYYNAIPNSGI